MEDHKPLIQVIQGDAREITPKFTDGSFDVLATDPPYGVPVEWEGGFDYHLGDSDLDATIALADWLMHEAARVVSEDGFVYLTVWDTILAETMISGRNAGFTIQTFAWVKPGGGVAEPHSPWMYAMNPCIIGYRRITPPQAWPHPPWRNWINLQSVQNKSHPTEKPLKLYEYWLSRTPGKVLDPFCGSGTTLVAAQELGLSAVGIERSPEFAHTARQRLGLEA